MISIITQRYMSKTMKRLRTLRNARGLLRVGTNVKKLESLDGSHIPTSFVRISFRNAPTDLGDTRSVSLLPDFG